MKQNSYLVAIILFTATAILQVSCSKESSPGPTTDPCVGKTIVITATPTAANNCSANNGSIAVSATGSTGFTFKIGSGAYQASGTFTNVSAGSETVFVKDADGCVQSKPVTITADPAGPLFSAVKSLIAAKCQSCHNGNNQSGGRNWVATCNIIEGKERIKVRAVDEGTMPQAGSLTQPQKDIITNWINAGGKFSD